MLSCWCKILFKFLEKWSVLESVKKKHLLFSITTGAFALILSNCHILSVQFHNILQILHRIVHSLCSNVFTGTVEGVTAGSEVGAGKTHEGKTGTVSAAADGYCYWGKARLLNGSLCVVDQVHAGLNLFFHIAVLLFDGECDGSDRKSVV